ncbi:glucose-induced degradation protein 4 homolog [Chenopodium quinoa]|uniref:glucose-induced degradation protein 4 homolog n=1 Tax=Chenopodium quinoa TaxID=63459 RepID=UPI000B76D68A|nr:glucose-induced degradation protein 4 homolog [Chenopodium quinoa]
MPVRVSENSVPSQIPGSCSEHTSPPPCTLLRVGQAFSGTQNVSSVQKDEAWRVNVRIQGCDLEHGYLCGTMEALNVPMADTPVVTFWEGEIVDTKNYTFFTGKWEATPEDDIRHWTKFQSFAPLLSQVEVDGGKSLDLSNYPFIFMRWKEQYFVSVGTDCGLTIAGFYYVCFSCSDGSIHGFYYDPNSSPFQKLELKSSNEGRYGFSFSTYDCNEDCIITIVNAVETALTKDPKCKFRFIRSGLFKIRGAWL